MLHATITASREESEKLKSETREIVGKLTVAEASQGAERSRVYCLREVNATLQGNVKFLQAGLVEDN